MTTFESPITLDQLSKMITAAKRQGYRECLADDVSFIQTRAGYSGDMKMYDLADDIRTRVNPYGDA